MKLPIDDETWHRVIRSEKLKLGKKKDEKYWSQKCDVIQR